ncbi:DUF6708 domain-containing protein [Pseudomonas sp. NPDC089401]|uniref:DUF6708 domain-containing protein n=1 Tax=Pseudomonas sp. NPDC089401 TaxID=3364462 RepID=UPI00380D9073
MIQPLLNPPCSGWKEDLPLPDAPPMEHKGLGNDTPNHMDEIYLETPRKTVAFRNTLFLANIACTAFILNLLFSTTNDAPTSLATLCTEIIGLVSCTWTISLLFRLSTNPPRDEPIRFNRARQKIYAYNFKCRWWHPLDKGRITPISYDWLQVRAERWEKRGVMPNGGIIFKTGVMLSIVEPGTNTVIDRFSLTAMGADQYAWAYVCAYMQEGPSALPPPGEPKDHNDILWCEIASRLAPKVEWPPEMDLESRTAPENQSTTQALLQDPTLQEPQ